MMLLFRWISAFFILFSTVYPLFSQEITVSGTLADKATGQGISNAEVRLLRSDLKVYTSETGNFLLILEEAQGFTLLRFSHPDYYARDTIINNLAISLDVGIVKLEKLPAPGADEFQLSNAEADFEEEEQNNVSSILNASRDVFSSVAAFNFSNGRYRSRGYDSEFSEVYLNGVLMNDLEDGRVNWYEWGGLNDVLRNRIGTEILAATDYGYGDIAGSVEIDLRASNQWDQTRISYASSNRSYRHRIMMTSSSGIIPGGWAYSTSVSWRWAQEGYVEGTLYDAFSSYLSVDKIFSERSSLNFTYFGASNKRGGYGASVEEVRDLTDDTYYNPYWGYQSGEKRNSRIGKTFLPVFMLRFDHQVNDKLIWETAASFQTGENSRTALEWYDAPDPRPDYYRKLPSWFEEFSPLAAERVAEQYATDPSVSQIDWNRFFDVNRNNIETVEDGQGNLVTGARSKYIVEDRHYDKTQTSFHSRFQWLLSDNASLEGGILYGYFLGENYKEVEDLLGGDYYLDYDQFAERDFPDDSIALQNDLNDPDVVITKGEKFGYNYDAHIHRCSSWLQYQLTTAKFDYFLAGRLTYTTFWREGNTRTGQFPNSSFGDSEKPDFFDPSFKAGITYKLTGRHYFYTSALWEKKAPLFRHSFISPRKRNQLVDGLESETVYSGEIGYQARFPKLKGRATLYYTGFEDQVLVRSFYHDEFRTFVNYVLTGIDRRHAGLEAAVEASITEGLDLTLAAGIGEYIYTGRPEVVVVQDNNATQLNQENDVVYIKNFYVANGPQHAYSAGLNYSSKHFWFASLNVNYFDKIFINYNPTRRTEAAVNDPDIVPDGKLWNDILAQEQVDGQFTLDFFGGKSFKIDEFFIYLNLGVSNILDNTEFITGGYEQNRFDFEDKDVDQFPSKYYYSYGRTYYASLAFRF